MPEATCSSTQQLAKLSVVAAVGLAVGCTLGVLVKNSAPPAVGKAAAQRTKGKATPKRKVIPVHLLEEQLARNQAFFGSNNGQQLVMRARVAVFGAAGAGSHCIHMLVRSGVQHVVIVDDSVVTEACLRTNALAQRQDVGRPCGAVLKGYCEAFSNASIDLEHIDGESARKAAQDDAQLQRVIDRVFSSFVPDYVVDCLDASAAAGAVCARTLRLKQLLLRECTVRHVPTLSLMTTEGLVDPTRVRVSSLGELRGDPVGVLMQKHLLGQAQTNSSPVRDDATDDGSGGGGGDGGSGAAATIELKVSGGATSGRKKSEQERLDLEARAFGRVCAVSSSESWRGCPALGVAERTEAVEAGDGAMACVFGMALASKCLCDLAEQPIVDPLPTPGLAPGTLKQLRKSLNKTEKKISGAGPRDKDIGRDIEFVAGALCNVGSSLDHTVRFTGKNLECRCVYSQGGPCLTPRGL
eukprot:INCI15475.3.p1 GENE.INCI15475.3~~INCI15475.3.p1  ORF type:complete len:468 (-),score=96.10 INCI15475.3:91-1494(-)